MSTPSKIKRLIKERGYTKTFLVKELKLNHASNLSHALNPDSPRYKTQAMQDIRTKLYKYLSA